MEDYLSSGRVDHIFMLIDIRHAPTEDDKLMLQWIIYYNLPFTLIATKADKIAKSKRAQMANAAAKQLGAPPAVIAFSSEDGWGRDFVLQRMDQVVKDVKNLRAGIDIEQQ